MLRLSTKSFTHYKEKKEFVAEISDFGATDQVFMDIVKNGIALTSYLTQGEATFKFAGYKRDRDGDIEYYWLIPTFDTVRVKPDLNGYKIVLLND